MQKIEYIVKYRVYEYEPQYGSGPNREEVFTDLRLATKRRNRINRYVQNALRGPQFLSQSYIRRAEEYDRAMTDHVSFQFTTSATLVERVTTEREIS